MLWLRIRCWWHSFREHMMIDSAPAGGDSVLCNCSCGGYAQVVFECEGLDHGFDHGAMTVEYATCPMYLRYMRRGVMPTARLLKESP